MAVAVAGDAEEVVAIGLNNGSTTGTDVTSPVSAGAAENVGTPTRTLEPVSVATGSKRGVNIAAVVVITVVAIYGVR